MTCHPNVLKMGFTTIQFAGHKYSEVKHTNKGTITLNKLIISRVAGFAAALFMGTALHADSFLYNATASNGDSVNAVITASATSTAGQEDITAITGTVSYLGSTYNITGLVSDPTYSPMTTPDGSFIIDNILNTSGGPAFDYYGLGFTDSMVLPKTSLTILRKSFMSATLAPIPSRIVSRANAWSLHPNLPR